MADIKTAHIISHTHWDREWYLNSPYTNEWLVPFFDALFRMLDQEPGYRFVLDGQTCLIEDWLDQVRRQRQETAPLVDRLRGYVQKGQLLAGPYYLQPDWQLVSDEALVRNLLIGRQTAAELGGAMQVGWLLDNFGQVSQAPQIHRQFGLRGLFVWRGVEMEPDEIQSEFEWRSPDGSFVTAIYLLSSYRNAMRLAEFAPVMWKRIRDQALKLAPFATTSNILLMNGYDQEVSPDDILPPLARQAKGSDLRVRQSTPEEYLAAVTAERPALRPISGALYSGRYIAVFPGILSSRMYLKQQNDLCQKQLEKLVEPLDAILWGLGRESGTGTLQQAWKLLLKNHPHDSICGVSIDDVHSDMEERFAQVNALAEQLTAQSLATLAAHVDTSRSPDGQAAWIVVNPLARERQALVEIRDAPQAAAFYAGGGYPLAAQQGPDGEWLVSVPLPACGYTTLHASPGQPPAPARTAHAVHADPARGLLENDWVSVQFRPDGTLDVTDKAGGAIYSGLGCLQDGGDAGDTYDYAFPPRDRVVESQGRPAKIVFLEGGPLRARVQIAQELLIPGGLAPDRSARSDELRPLQVITEVSLEAESPLIRFHTHVDNTIPDHRLRVCFPTRLRADVSAAETQFDVVTRRIVPPSFDDSSLPESVRQIVIGARSPQPVTIFPQRSFVDVSDGVRGLAVLNTGLPEYEIIPGDNTIALTLFRSVGWIARSDLLTRIGDAGPLIATPGAQCMRPMTFDYALLPHRGDWQANVLSLAGEYTTPWLLARTGAHPGVLRERAEFLRLDGAPLQVTAIKRAEDGNGLIVRFFNPSDQIVHAVLTSAIEIRRAWSVTLAEDEPQPLGVDAGHLVRVSAPPHGIVTLRIEIVRRQLALLAPAEPAEPHRAFTPAAPPATPRDLADEESRANALEAQWREKQRATAAHPCSSGELAAEYVRLRLEEETAHRAYLEARLSATLLRKNALPPEKRAEFEPAIRAIGDELNAARVNKRALEYVLDACL